MRNFAACTPLDAREHEESLTREALWGDSSPVLVEDAEDYVYNVERGPLFDVLDYYTGLTSNQPRFIAIPTGQLVFNTQIWDTELGVRVSRHTDFLMAVMKAIRMNRRNAKQ